MQLGWSQEAGLLGLLRIWEATGDTSRSRGHVIYTPQGKDLLTLTVRFSKHMAHSFSWWKIFALLLTFSSWLPNTISLCLFTQDDRYPLTPPEFELPRCGRKQQSQDEGQWFYTKKEEIQAGHEKIILYNEVGTVLAQVAHRGRGCTIPQDIQARLDGALRNLI